MSRLVKPIYRVPSDNVDEIIAHKLISNIEHYLVRWRGNHPRNAVLSWHNISELCSCMPLLQDYLKAVQASPKFNLKPLLSDSRKRKAPHDSTSSVSSNSSTPPSSFSTPSSTRPSHEVYNGVLQRKSGRFMAKESSSLGITRVDASQMPDAAMIEEANRTSIYNGLTYVRNAFLLQLHRAPGPPIKFKNMYDSETPSLRFEWIPDYVLGEGVERMADEVLEGCSKCRADMGGAKGCEYTQRCGCLEYAAPDGSDIGLRKMDDEQLEILRAWQAGENVDHSGLPKRFPYTSTGNRANCLESFYLNSRYVIYECNQNCKCGPRCKTRNVQFGRKVSLEIFRTPGRGFGLHCLQPLKRGQFIDKYLGELITDEEADAREKASEGEPGRASYLFWLDKNMVPDNEPGLHQEDCVVADGEAMGGPTRFINHSCNPNCRLFTVSYNKYDQRIYDLAFFALYDIDAGEELTFDYMDPEPDEDEALALKNSQAKFLQMDTEGKTRVACLCGAKNCRGYMWE